MSGNGSGYSNFTPGPDNVLPNPPVKGTEAGCDQMSMISKAVGGKKMRKMRKSAKLLKGGSSCSGKPNSSIIQSAMMGGKKSKKYMKKTRKTMKK